MGEERGSRASRAVPRHADPVSFDTGRSRTRYQYRAEIQIISLPRGGEVEGLEHLGTHLVARLTDRRTQVHVDLVDPAGHLVTKDLQSSLQDPSSRSPPTHVQKCDGPPGRIDDENGYAVRHGNGQQHARRPGSVAIAGRSELEAGRSLAVDMHMAAV